jgi:hypothetical protein
MKLTKLLTGIAALAVLGASAPAKADYFDGCRGPNEAQIDQRIGLTDESYTLLPKAFIDRDDDGSGLFAVAPFNYSPGSKPNAGAGIGGFLDLGRIKLLGVVPVVYSAEKEIINMNPTIYATMMAGNFLFDPRVSYLASIRGDNLQHNLSFGATLGYKIDDIIVGFDLETGFDPHHPKTGQLEEALNYQGIIRVDLDEKHKHWIEAYFGKDALGLGFRANFDWKTE